MSEGSRSVPHMYVLRMDDGLCDEMSRVELQYDAGIRCKLGSYIPFMQHVQLIKPPSCHEAASASADTNGSGRAVATCN